MRKVEAVTIVEFARAFLADAPVGVVLTDAQPEHPGPTILYANAAFGRLVGREPREIIGLSPRFMQGRETRRATLDAFHRAVAAGERFHGYLTNYRGDGTKYRAEIDCHPLHSDAGVLSHFVAFEREVVRRRGRPAVGMAGRYEPSGQSNEALTPALRLLGAFVAEGK